MRLQKRRELADDLLVAGVDRALHGTATDVQVAARLGLCRHAQHRADRLAVDEDDPLVALCGLGQEALRERPPRAGAGRGLEDRRRIRIAIADDEDAEAAVAIDRLDDDRPALLLLERA